MSDDAAKRPIRDEKGRLLPGHGAPGPGKPALPSWFKEKGPQAIALLWAAASGEVAEGLPDVVKKTAENLAADIDHKTRVAAIDKVIERIHGKVKDTVEVDVTGRDAFVDAMLAMAHKRREGDDDDTKRGDTE